MFEKAENLFSTPGNVTEKSGAVDGSFIVAGSANKVHSVTVRQGTSFTCDCNLSSKSCEYTMTIAKMKGSVQEFVAWFRRSNKRATIKEVAGQGRPKMIRRKANERKRSYANYYFDNLLGVYLCSILFRLQLQPAIINAIH